MKVAMLCQTKGPVSDTDWNQMNKEEQSMYNVTLSQDALLGL